MKRIFLLLLLIGFYTSPLLGKKKVYMTYILHGNMNYDRYTRSTIWKEFPIIYNNLLDFMDEHPEFKGQLQFSGQTLGSLLITAPHVVEHAKKIHQRGQLNFTGTFYSEPVNVNMNGETNYRCAWLGTKIIEDNIGSTDGFYLQERAYHPQLPWIFNHANVSWTPIITNDDSAFPFRLRGLDGSLSVCVPITRGNFLQDIQRRPHNSLIAIEEDYEIPQTFTEAYNKVNEFNASQKDIEIEWITVKEYIDKFGIKPEKYIDHSSKASERNKGTYSRWSSDPLDIILQNQTNSSMHTYRCANAVDALAQYLYGQTFDMTFSQTNTTLKEEPLAWDIEQATMYSSLVNKYLVRNGRFTELSQAEHLLLWAVNSDAKGWYPLYERRQERINALKNSENLSLGVIHKALQTLACHISTYGYDKYYIVANLEQQRKSIINLTTDANYTFYDYSTNKLLKSYTIFQDGKFKNQLEVLLPSYGYMVIGAKCQETCNAEVWEKENSISNGNLSLSVQGTKVLFNVSNGKDIEISLDSFMLKPLTQMDLGNTIRPWKWASECSPVRVSVCKDGIYPRLKIDRQMDWLLHVEQIYTLKEDRLLCDYSFHFPHPTLVRKDTPKEGINFSPEGLNLLIKTNCCSKVGFDIPYGNSLFEKPGTHYFCALSSCFLQYENRDGLLAVLRTGEQAFKVNSNNGELCIYLGASTTSGPIRRMGLQMKTPTHASHDLEWYAEPFHGVYKHSITLYPYSADTNLPTIVRQENQPIFVQEFVGNSGSADLPTKGSIIECSDKNIDITNFEYKNGKLILRLNELIGKESDAIIRVYDKTIKQHFTPYGIIECQID